MVDSMALMQQRFELFEKVAMEKFEEHGAVVKESYKNAPEACKKAEEQVANQKAQFPKTLVALQDRMDNKWNKLYVNFHEIPSAAKDAEEEGGEGCQVAFWEKFIYPQTPYYCPEGFLRYAIQFESQEWFDKKFKGWYVAYHGTSQKAVVPILNSHIKKALRNDGLKLGGAYFSPSIVYASHSRYAEWWDLEDGNKIQFILQCRINPNAISFKKAQTMGITAKIDRHFDNEEIEWIVVPEDGENLNDDQVVCTGIMVRERPASDFTHKTGGSCPQTTVPPLPGNHW